MKITGDVEIIRFRNEENGYSVVVLDVDGEPVTASGTFPPVKEGMRLSLTGKFVMHPRFGRQFSAETAESVMPDNSDGMIRYLGSGIIKGIGPRTALSIVGRFKDKTFLIMEKHPERLAEVRGISKTKALEVGARFAELKVMNEAMMFMQSHGITLGAAMKIYSVYGENSVKTISDNPYRLIEDVDGIGFIRADAIAKKLGFDCEGRPRLRAGLVYTLKEACDGGGNTFLPEDELIATSIELLGAGSEEEMSAVLDELAVEGQIKRLVIGDVERAVMLRRIYRAEKGVAVALARMTERANAIVEDVTEDIAQFEKLNKVTLAEKQASAVRLAVSSGVCVITGGPGTGKTTILKCVLGIFERRGDRVMLMAPTGRAAKRLSESTGKAASTIHRALGTGSEPDDEKGALKADAVIVDEVSMMDVALTDMLLKRVRQDAKIIFVGDKDQLPSVGAGNVLADMLACGEIPSVRLDTVFRQDKESLIVWNAHKINNGEMPELGAKDGDFFFSSVSDPEQAARVVVDMAARRIPKYLGCEPYKVQVLCPMKNGACGTVALNEELRKAMNPFIGTGELREENALWRTGDKVMHIVNNYTLEWTGGGYIHEQGKGVFNGDLGTIVAVRKEDGEIDVRFEDGRTAIYTSETRSQLTPAYAITVHKSQGCEFDAVIIPITGGGPMIMTRNLLYTAITRAKKMAVIVGSEYWVKRMVDNNYIKKRYSALKDFIIDSARDKLKLFGDNDDER